MISSNKTSTATSTSLTRQRHKLRQDKGRRPGGTVSRGAVIIHSGNFDIASVNRLVHILKSDALNAELKPDPVSENTIGPTLGRDTIHKGLIAVAASFGAVLAFMVVYYRFSGLVACVALFSNLLLTIGFMVAVNAAFTLPGLAGVVLMLGMAVDANVLIYERIREDGAWLVGEGGLEVGDGLCGGRESWTLRRRRVGRPASWVECRADGGLCESESSEDALPSSEAESSGCGTARGVDAVGGDVLPSLSCTFSSKIFGAISAVGCSGNSNHAHIKSLDHYTGLPPQPARRVPPITTPFFNSS